MPAPSNAAARAARVLLIVLVAALVGGALAAPAGAAPPPSSGSEQLVPLGVPDAWRLSTGAGVTVAVLDSGVDASHPDLAGRVLPGKDFVDGSTDGRVDPVGHGTAVASLIAGGGDGVVSGLAPDASILPVRVLDSDNRYGSSATVAEALMWAVEQGAQVVNLSLGGDSDSGPLGAAIAFAMANDVVVVACTGNDLTGSGDAVRRVWYPAREPGVVAVAGLEWVGGDPRHWPSSVTGRETVLSAPAVLSAAQPGGGFREVQGTSFASALVAAAAALVRARLPEASAGQVVYRLLATARDLGEPGRDDHYGYGALDPVRALTASLPPVSANPLDTKLRHGQVGFGRAPGSSVTPVAPGRFTPPRRSASTRDPGGSPVAAGLERLTPLSLAGAPVAVAGAPVAVAGARRPLRRRSRCPSPRCAACRPRPPVPPRRR